MKYLNGKYSVEVKFERYTIHPEENTSLGQRNLLKSLRIQYQVQNETKI